jgi:hypothetical protein
VVRHYRDRRLAHSLQRDLLGLRHLHIPRTTWYDGVRFEEVSVGYPREWRRRKPYRWLRQVLPDPKYAPGYLNEFGGHFEITQEMRDHAEKVQQRIQSRQS